MTCAGCDALRARLCEALAEQGKLQHHADARALAQTLTENQADSYQQLSSELQGQVSTLQAERFALAADVDYLISQGHVTQKAYTMLQAGNADLRTQLAEAKKMSAAWCRKALRESDASWAAELKVAAYRAEYEKAINDGRLAYGQAADRWVSQLRAIKDQVHVLVTRFAKASMGPVTILPPDLFKLRQLADDVQLPDEVVEADPPHASACNVSADRATLLAALQQYTQAMQLSHDSLRLVHRFASRIVSETVGAANRQQRVRAETIMDLADAAMKLMVDVGAVQPDAERKDTNI